MRATVKTLNFETVFVSCVKFRFLLHEIKRAREKVSDSLCLFLVHLYYVLIFLFSGKCVGHVTKHVVFCTPNHEIFLLIFLYSKITIM